MLAPLLHAAAHTPLLAPLVDEVSADPIKLLVNYGLAGLVLILVITGQLRTKAELGAVQKISDERLQDLRAKDAMISALVQQVQRAVPQLGRMADVVEALPGQGEDRLLTQIATLSRKLDEIQGAQRGQ